MPARLTFDQMLKDCPYEFRKVNGRWQRRGEDGVWRRMVIEGTSRTVIAGRNTAGKVRLRGVIDTRITWR